MHYVKYKLGALGAKHHHVIAFHLEGNLVDLSNCTQAQSSNWFFFFY